MRRQLDLFLPGPFSGPLPIHCWAVEHEDRVLLVDSGETAAARNVPFARFHVTSAQELPSALAQAGLSIDDVAEVVLTHHHGDHVDGLVHVRSPVRINRAELDFLREPFSTVMRRVLRQPLPPGFAPQPFELDGGPFGAFPRSRALSEDGRIVAVGHPGPHGRAHLGDRRRRRRPPRDARRGRHRHAGAAVSRRADAVAPDTAVHVATLERILAHCAEHPTVYLPSHDPESARRLAESETVASPAHSARCRQRPGRMVRESAA